MESGDRITLLYVEDEPEARERIRSTISSVFPDFVLHTADNGSSGLELFLEKKPDIILTDISMPVMSGIQMAAEIRKTDPGVEIIFLTAHSDTQYLLDAIKVGISHYLLKPIDYDKLLEVIEQCVTRINLERQVRKQDESIRKLYRAIEQSPSTILITDTKGTIEYVNPKFTRLSGYSAEEAIGQNPRILKGGFLPHDVYENLWSTITAGLEWRGEFLNRKKDGDLYWEAASISPVFNGDGEITHFVAVKEDITERKRAEQEIETLNTHLAARATELESANQELETFNSMVSHDLRRPLSNINGYCQVILELHGKTLNKECTQFIRDIYEGTLRMNKLISTLLDFSRLNHRQINLQAVDLSRMAQVLIAELRVANPQRQVKVSIEEGIKVMGDLNLLRVVLENLLGNAWKYTGKKETAVIEFGRMAGEEQVCFVRDNGAGFDNGQAEKIFSPFQRLHGSDEFEGTGIGLATVHRIVTRHGGRIWADGEVGKGATFYFTV